MILAESVPCIAFKQLTGYQDTHESDCENSPVGDVLLSADQLELLAEDGCGAAEDLELEDGLEITATALGGEELEPFEATFLFPEPVEPVTIEAVAGEPATVRWEAGSGAFVKLFASSSRSDTGEHALIECVAADTGELTIGGTLTEHLLPSPAITSYEIARVYHEQLPQPGGDLVVDLVGSRKGLGFIDVIVP